MKVESCLITGHTPECAKKNHVFFILCQACAQQQLLKFSKEVSILKAERKKVSAI